VPQVVHPPHAEDLPTLAMHAIGLPVPHVVNEVPHAVLHANPASVRQSGNEENNDRINNPLCNGPSTSPSPQVLLHLRLS
jgi:hypothetical protein